MGCLRGPLDPLLFSPERGLGGVRLDGIDLGTAAQLVTAFVAAAFALIKSIVAMVKFFGKKEEKVGRWPTD